MKRLAFAAALLAFGSPALHVYRPETLDAFPKKDSLPVMVWGNGGCAIDSTRYGGFLTTIASHGFLVMGTVPQEGAARRQESADDVRAAIDWAAKENARAESPLKGKIALDKIAVMGQSCGGVQAIEVAADSRVGTAVIWNSGLFGEPTNMGGGKTLSKKDLESIHVPVAYISGDPQDIAFKNAEADFDYVTKIPAFRAYERGVGHGGTYREPNGGEFSGIAVAWLNWQLKGDQHAALMFRGPDCGLCVNPKWVVRTKNLK